MKLNVDFSELKRAIAMMRETRVINIKRDEKPDNYTYIGRGSKWGNPFVMNSQSNRDVVVKLYKEYIENKKELMNDLEELRGRTLGCYCKPLKCHGDVLIELLNKKGGE